MLRSCSSLAVFLALTLVGPDAGANGRFPRAQQLVVHPSAPNELAVRATYGLLGTPDHGRTWSWVCEEAPAYGDREDPAIALTGNGTLLVATVSGLLSSGDGGCTWERAPELTGRAMVDVVVLPDAPSTVLALSTRRLESGEVGAELWESEDGGRSWQPRGTPLVGIVPTALAALESGNLLYASALSVGAEITGLLLRSADGGESWEQRRIPGSAHGVPLLAAVHPADPNDVLVRLDAPVEPRILDGGARRTAAGEDRLLRTPDGGQSWTTVLAGHAELWAVAISPDGSSVVAGFGDPRDGTWVDSGVVGLWRAPASTGGFERVLEGSVSCATWTPRGLYVCSSEADTGFEIGVGAGDASALAFTPVMTQDAPAPRACPAASAADTACGSVWLYVCFQLGQCPDPWGRDATAPDAPEPEPLEPVTPRGGCDCALRTAPAPGLFGTLATIAAWLAPWRRRIGRVERRRPHGD